MPTFHNDEQYYLVCRGCGNVSDSMESALTHYTVGASSDSGTCADEGYDMLPESEAF